MNIYLFHRVPILLEELRYTIGDIFPHASINLYNSLETIYNLSLNNNDILFIHIENVNPDVIKALKRLRKKNIKILVWIDSEDEVTIMNLLQQKFFGYLLNSFQTEELLEALKLFQQNKPYLQPKLSSLFLEIYLKEQIHKEKPPHVSLTKREWEVLQLICTGSSNEQVANQLYLTESTVKNHVSSILNKLDVPDRTSAVVKVYKNKWVNI